MTTATGGTRLLANTVVGLGFSARGFQLGLEMEPDLIGCDAGSADFGPYYLGSGTDPKGRPTVRRDLALMLEGARARGIPLVIGSCGGTGAAPQLEGYRQIVREIAAEKGFEFTLATIPADQPADFIAAKVRSGEIEPLGPVPALSLGDLDGTTRIVGMMGVTPLVQALASGADVILAGRCVDPAIFACLPLLRGVDPGLAWHAAKSIDKGYLATAYPSGGSPVMATIGTAGFTVEPTRPQDACTVRSVSAMTAYENPNPFTIVQPEGVIDTRETVYTALDERRVHVAGSKFQRAEQLTVKLEGAAPIGHRSILIAGIRNPAVLRVFPKFLAEYKALAGRVARSLRLAPEDYRLTFRSYGFDAVLGDLEDTSPYTPREVGLIVDVVARTEEISRTLAARLGPTGSRLDITGKLGGGGNFAYPFSPAVVSMGTAYRWSVWHRARVTTDEMTAMFPVHLERVSGPSLAEVAGA